MFEVVRVKVHITDARHRGGVSLCLPAMKYIVNVETKVVDLCVPTESTTGQRGSLGKSNKNVGVNYLFIKHCETLKCMFSVNFYVVLLRLETFVVVPNSTQLMCH